MNSDIIRLEHACVARDGVTLLDNVRANVFCGEILSVVSYYGKDLLALGDIMSGTISLDSGYLFYNEKRTVFSSVSHATNMGVFRIEKESKLLGNLSVAQNLFAFRTNAPFVISIKDYNRSFEILKTQFNLPYLANTLVKSLDSFERVTLEFIKAYVNGARLILVDDILSEYSPIALNSLFKIISLFKAEEISVVFFSKSVSFANQIADRMLIMRNGRNVGVLPPHEFNAPYVTSMVIGENPLSTYQYKCLCNYNSHELKFHYLSKSPKPLLEFVIHEGESVGIYDIEKLYEDADTNYFLRDMVKQRLIISENNVNYHIRSIAEAADKGIFFFQNGIPDFYLFNNLSIGQHLLIKCGITRQKLFFPKKASNYIQKEFTDFHGLAFNTSTKHLSIAEAYYLVLYKYNLIVPKLLICLHPLTHLDDAVKERLYPELFELRKKGTRLIFFSSNMAELSTLCDKIIVISRDKAPHCYTNEQFRELTSGMLF